MTNHLPDTCYGCAAPLTPAVGVCYCPSCVAAQERAAREERAAFEAYHAFADLVARRTR